MRISSIPNAFSPRFGMNSPKDKSENKNTIDPVEVDRFIQFMNRKTQDKTNKNEQINMRPLAVQYKQENKQISYTVDELIKAVNDLKDNLLDVKPINL